MDLLLCSDIGVPHGLPFARLLSRLKEEVEQPPLACTIAGGSFVAFVMYHYTRKKAVVISSERVMSLAVVS